MCTSDRFTLGTIVRITMRNHVNAANSCRADPLFWWRCCLHGLFAPNIDRSDVTYIRRASAVTLGARVAQGAAKSLVCCSCAIRGTSSPATTKSERSLHRNRRGRLVDGRYSLDPVDLSGGGSAPSLIRGRPPPSPVHSARPHQGVPPTGRVHPGRNEARLYQCSRATRRLKLWAAPLRIGCSLR